MTHGRNSLDRTGPEKAVDRECKYFESRRIAKMEISTVRGTTRTRAHKEHEYFAGGAVRQRIFAERTRRLRDQLNV